MAQRLACKWPLRMACMRVGPAGFVNIRHDDEAIGWMADAAHGWAD
jgi:hypothetical protein